MARSTDTRTRMLFAACRALERGGEPAVNVHKIAKAAGVAVPSLYHHFGSRKGLVEEAQAYRYEEGMKTMAVRLQTVMTRATSKTKFASLIRSYLETVVDEANADFRRVRVSVLVSAYNNPRLMKRIVAANETLVNRLYDYLAPAIEKGWIAKDVDLRSLIFWSNSVLNGRVIIELDPARSYNEGWNQLYVDTAIYALGLD